MRRHTLIIGGTGMLRETSCALANRCDRLTSVARTQQSLRAMDEALASTPCDHHPLALDWSEPESFLSALADHVRRVGHPSLVLAWLHDEQLGPMVTRAVAPERDRCDFFHVRSSAAADPAGGRELPGSLDLPGSVRYHQIILGFHIGADGSRWLHDSEISAGVLAAIEQRRNVFIVGSVEPWSSRP